MSLLRAATQSVLRFLLRRVVGKLIAVPVRRRLAAFDAHKPTALRPIVQLSGDDDECRTEAGIPCGAVTGLTAKMQKRVIRWLYCVPAVAGKIKDVQAKYYLCLRLSLTRPVGLIVAANPSTMLNLARAGDAEKESLIRDIHDGTLSDRYDIPAEVRAGLSRRRLGADPARARE